MQLALAQGRDRKPPHVSPELRFADTRKTLRQNLGKNIMALSIRTEILRKLKHLVFSFQVLV